MTPKAAFSPAVGQPHRIDPRAATCRPNAKLRGLSGWVKLPAALSAVLLGCLSSGCVGNAGSPIVSGVKPEKVAKARHAGEGPAWNAREGALYYVGDNRISKVVPGDVSRDYRNPVRGANGLLFDREGRLLACEAGNRRVTRTEKNGSVTVLASAFAGKQLNSPNDLSVDSSGRVYFTDPRYGNRDTMEQRDASGSLVESVYRIDAPGKVVRVLGRDSVDRPNGVLVSPDDKHLFVADNNNTAGGTRKLWRFDLRPDGSVDARSRRLVFDWKTSRGPDGLKIDRRNRLYVAAGLNVANPPHETAKPYTGGVYVFSYEGKRLDFISIPDDEVTNCAFGGPDLKTLYITAGGALWSVRVDTPGNVVFDPLNPSPGTSRQTQ
jgi:gluconolactonase